MDRQRSSQAEMLKHSSSPLGSHSIVPCTSLAKANRCFQVEALCAPQAMRCYVEHTHCRILQHAGVRLEINPKVRSPGVPRPKRLSRLCIALLSVPASLNHPLLNWRGLHSSLGFLRSIARRQHSRCTPAASRKAWPVESHVRHQNSSGLGMQSDTETLESNTFTSRQKRTEPWQPANSTQHHENVAEGGFTLAANMHDKHTAPQAKRVSGSEQFLEGPGLEIRCGLSAALPSALN